MYGSILRLSLVQRLRGLWGTWKRSLLVLVLLPSMAVGGYHLLDEFQSQLLAYFVEHSPEQRLEAWYTLVRFSWLGAFFLSVAVAISNGTSRELPWSLELLPGRRALKRAVWGVPALLLWVAATVVVVAHFSTAASGGLGYFRADLDLALTGLAVYLLGGAVTGSLSAWLVDRLLHAARRAPRPGRRPVSLGARPPWLRPATEGLALGAGIALLQPWSRGVEGYFADLSMAHGSAWAGLAGLGAVLAVLVAAAYWTLGAEPLESGPLEPGADPARTGTSRSVRFARTPWVRDVQVYLRAMVRERSTLTTALFGQLFVFALLFAAVNSPLLAEAPEEVRFEVATGVLLLLPFIWGSFSTLVGGIAANRGGQLLGLPTDPLADVWGRLVAGLAFSGLNWAVSVALFVAFVPDVDWAANLGVSLGYLVLAVAVALYVGRISPPDVSTFRAVQGSNETWIHLALLTALAWAVSWGATKIPQTAVDVRLVELLSTLPTATLFVALTYWDEVRCGLRHA